MGFVESIKTCFSKYFVFSGRGTRSEYWYFQLFVWSSFFIEPILILLSLSIAGETYTAGLFILDFLIGIFRIIFVVSFIPGISAAVRRLHDVNRSGWWWFIPLTIIGSIPYLYWMTKRSDTGANKYGAKPAK